MKQLGTVIGTVITKIYVQMSGLPRRQFPKSVWRHKKGIS